MGRLLRALFGRSNIDEIWGQIARDLGGRFEEGDFFRSDVLRYRSGEWEITLDTYYRQQGKVRVLYTRMRAPFVNKDGFYFEIYREGIFSPVGRFLGMQDVEIGDTFFDEEFVIKGNDETKLRRLFADETLKDLIRAQPEIELQIKDDEGWFGATFPEGVDELYFECRKALDDERLVRSLFDLFTATLERLVQIDSAYADDPEVTL